MWVIYLTSNFLELDSDAQYKVRAFQRDIHNLCDGSLFQYSNDGLNFHVVHLMGWRYVTYKYIKVSFSKMHLFESLDNDDKFIIPPKKHRWWEKN